MDLIARFSRSSQAPVNLDELSMRQIQLGLLDRLNDLFKYFYITNSIESRFFDLFRVQPLSILAPIQRRKACRGG